MGLAGASGTFVEGRLWCRSAGRRGSFLFGLRFGADAALGDVVGAAIGCGFASGVAEVAAWLGDTRGRLTVSSGAGIADKGGGDAPGRWTGSGDFGSAGALTDCETAVWAVEGGIDGNSATHRMNASGSFSSANNSLAADASVPSLVGCPAFSACAIWLMLTPIRRSSSSAFGSERTIPLAIVGGAGAVSGFEGFAGAGALPLAASNSTRAA